MEIYVVLVGTDFRRLHKGATRAFRTYPEALEYVKEIEQNPLYTWVEIHDLALEG